MRPSQSTRARGNDICGSNSGVEDAEARCIAAELAKLHKAGAIKSEQDASFYANLIHLFGASFTIRAGPYAPMPGSPSPEPGKPYSLTAAQRVKIPKGLSRKQEAEFLLRDLEEALAYEPTAEQLGESVIDLTGDVTSQSAPTVSELHRSPLVKS